MINEYAQKQIERIAVESINQDIKVAIYCATYNHGPYLADALEGFVNQQANFSFVAIVHDDASTDNTAEVLREYAAKYPNIIKPIYEKENQYSKRNGSIGRIMRKTIAEIKPDYVAYCEGDDYWIDNLKLQKQVDFLDKNPDFAACFSNCIEHSEAGRYPDEIRLNYIGGEVNCADLYSYHWRVPTASIIHRTKLFENKVYLKSISFSGCVFSDAQLILGSSLIGKIWYMDECMTVYRILSTGATMEFERNMCPYYKTRIKVAKIYGKEFVERDKKLVAKWFIPSILNLRKNFFDNASLVVTLLTYAPLDCMRELKWVWRKAKGMLNL